MYWLSRQGKRVGRLEEFPRLRQLGPRDLPVAPGITPSVKQDPDAEAVVVGDQPDWRFPAHQVEDEAGVVLGRFFIDDIEERGPGRWAIRGRWMPPGDR